MENSHSEEIASLFSSKEFLYPIWYFQLTKGFNILLHGYGSKRVLLKKFCESPIVLKAYRVFYIDGCNQSLTLDSILHKLHQEYIAHFDGSYKAFKRLTSIQEKCKYIISTLSQLMKQSNDPSFSFIDERPTPILFAISNIDGSGFTSPIRAAELKSFLYCALGQIEQFRFVATTDHINGPLLVDPTYISCARLLFYDVTTFLNYQEEIKSCDFSLYRGKKILDGNQQSHLSVITVLNNLSSNARKIYALFLHVQYKWACINDENMAFKINCNANTTPPSKTCSKSRPAVDATLSCKINSFSLKNLENSPSVNRLALKLVSSSPAPLAASSAGQVPDYLQFPGISFSVFFNLSLENFLVANDVSFKAIIHEFLDHNILCCKKSDEGEDVYHIPFKMGILILISKDLKIN
ncbi:Origin recognition complex subunit 2 [Mitosporidium daphniae]